jgi:chitinase
MALDLLPRRVAASVHVIAARRAGRLSIVDVVRDLDMSDIAYSARFPCCSLTGFLNMVLSLRRCQAPERRPVSHRTTRNPMNDECKMKNASAEGSRANSKVVYDGDPGNEYGAHGATEQKYRANRYDPRTETGKFSYTSGRVAKRVYNRYKPNDKKVFGYYTDWSQYDGRYLGDFGDADCGRGIDLMALDPFAYDKLIIGFLGIIGDKGANSAHIDQAARDFGRGPNEATFVDAWGDVSSYIDCGFDAPASASYPQLFCQAKAEGVLGGLREVHRKNPDLVMAFSIGGWTMSEAFHWVAADRGKRTTFINSVLHILTRFPMFTELDLDWEYPGAEGDSANTYDQTDAPHFASLVTELRTALDKAGRADVKISIAVSADVNKIKAARLDKMLEAGVYGFNLMTYDFFGTPWAEKLAHHTNLYPADAGGFSVEAAVDYLEQTVGVPLERVALGYAAYSRSGRNASIDSFSPLRGTYDPGEGTTTGSFESGVTEWYDLIYNYVDLENQKGLNGYDVYTDETADADYLYSPDSKLFLSVDTPRTVKAKGEFVRKRGLAGLFTWTIDLDNGLLVNAAREGLANEIAVQNIDMAPFYFKGINVGDGNRPPVAVIDGPTQAAAGATVTFTGARSTDADGDPLTYRWSAPGLSFDGQTTAEVSGAVPANPGPSYSVTLTVDDARGGTDQAQHILQVQSGGDRPPVAKLLLQLDSGTPFQLSGAQSSDPDGDALTFRWNAPGLPFDGSTDATVTASMPRVTETTDYTVQLSVSDGTSTSNDTVCLEARPASTPVQAVITGITNVASGAPLSLSGASSTGPGPLTYLWSAPGLPFDRSRQIAVDVTAPTVDSTTSYRVELTVAGNGGSGQASTATTTVTVSPSGDPGTWVPQDYAGGSTVTHDYHGQGLHTYVTQWWATKYDEPGNPACTGKTAADSKPWIDKGAV